MIVGGELDRPRCGAEIDPNLDEREIRVARVER